MATAPLFGGTNGVAVLDIGQPGGALNPGTAKFILRTNPGNPEVNRVASALPQQNVSFVDTLGFVGQTITWVGGLYAVNDAGLATIENNLSEVLTGQSIDNGVAGPVVVSRMRPTVLKNSLGRVIATRAIVDRIIWGDQISLAAGGFGFHRKLTVVFRKLA